MARNVKIYDYKGSVTCSWRIPATARQVQGQALKLARTYARLEQAKILDFFIEDIRGLKAAMMHYASVVFNVAIEKPEVLNVFTAIDNYTKQEGVAEIVEEKTREVAKETCNICLRDLVKPAFIAYRRGDEVVNMSKPFGIFCLKNFKGKLENLISGYTTAESGVLTAQADAPAEVPAQ